MGGSQTAKFVNVFTLVSFPLYGSLLYLATKYTEMSHYGMRACDKLDVAQH